MLITDLPEEILIIIIQKLDLFSLQNLYNTSKGIRSIVCLHGAVKQCSMSLNVMSTVKTLKLDFFKDISYSLLQLNMCGVPDLCKTAILPAMRRLRNLKVLDISFTNLDIIDFIEIYKACPTIKDITINFLSGQTASLTKDIMLQCQSIFKHFENIHFFGSLDLLYSGTILFVVGKVNLHHFKYTIPGRLFSPGQARVFHLNHNLMSHLEPLERTIPNFDQLTLCIVYWQVRRIPSNWNLENYPLLPFIKWEEYEYVIILIDELDPKVYASPIFKNFFKQTFHITAECISPSNVKFYHNMTVMLWNKAATNFNNCFYHALRMRVKHYFPYYFALQNELEELQASAVYDWFYTIPSVPVVGNSETMHRIGNKRLAPPKLLLNYDVAFKEKERVKFSILFKHPINNAIALTSGCEYLRKLTYFSLIKIGRYSSDFFNILFRGCVNLDTLNVEGLKVPSCASAIARSLPLTQTLKNLRLVEKGIDFASLFTSFIQCPTLANIYIVDESNIQNDLANPTLLVEGCKQLYSVYLEAQISGNTQRNILQMFNKTKSKCNRNYIHVTVKSLNESFCEDGNYDKFIEVFRLNPIRPA